MRKYSISKADCDGFLKDWQELRLFKKLKNGDVAHFFKDKTKLKMLPEIKLPLPASFAAAALWLY